MATTISTEDRKPLVLLEPLPAAEIVRLRVAKVEPPLAAVVQAETDPETCLRRLMAAGENREALRFLAAALRRRVQVWWGYLCVKTVTDHAREHRAAPTAGGGTAGMMAELAALPPVAPGAPAQAVLGVSPDIGLTAEQFQPPPPTVGGVDLSNPAAWPKPSIAADGTLSFLPPVLQHLRDAPLLRPDAADRFFAQRQAFIDALPPAARASFLEKDAGSAEAVRQVFGHSMSEIIEADRKAAFAAAGVGLDADPQAPHNQIKAALEAKKTELQGAIAGWQERIKAALAVVPRRAPPDLSGDTPRTAAAMEAARTWVLNPIRENGLAALAIGEQCEGMEQAAGFVAMACHFSGTDISPAGGPADAPPIPPPPGTAPAMLFAALEIARATPDTGRTPDEWLAVFLDLGVQVAQGLVTWDRALHERAATGHPWAGRPGFGRRHAQPDDPRPQSPGA